MKRRLATILSFFLATTHATMNKVDTVLADLRSKYPHQPTFLQAVEEMALSLKDLFEDPIDGAFYQKAFAVMTEPERIISFRVPWMDDQGVMYYQRGWRVEFNSALGPYKGGLRFHPTVDEGVLKFLGFEQTFKNALLSGLGIGGGKGGSDFNPRGRSEAEIRRFCESFMTELFRYIHPSTDVPAGDIGVGGREIGYMYGQYKRLTNRHGEGVLTGKSLLFGGSPFRPEATGYGLVYMTKLAVEKQLGKSMENLRCAISGSGNVAQFAADKLLQFGSKVVSMSDSDGVLVFKDGLKREELDTIMDHKNKKRGRLSELRDAVGATYYDRESPWTISSLSFDIALPCATQNEIHKKAAERMVSSGTLGVIEGANLPTDLEAQQVLRDANLLYIPGKASNAGGVGVSGLEMSQNAQKLTWKPAEVDGKLREMMENIFGVMAEEKANGGSLEEGANRAGFIKVAKAMRELGWVY